MVHSSWCSSSLKKNTFEHLQESWVFRENKQNANSMTAKNKTTGKARYFLTIKGLEGIVNNLVALFQLDSP